MKLWELELYKTYSAKTIVNGQPFVVSGCMQEKLSGEGWNDVFKLRSYSEVFNVEFTEVNPKKKVTLWRHWYFLGTNDIPSFCANMKNWCDIDPKDKIDCKFIKSTIIEEFEY